MRFLSIYKHVERDIPPSAEEMARMGKLVEEGMKAGFLLATEGCMPSALGARIRLAGDNIAVIDGPSANPRKSWAASPSFRRIRSNTPSS